MQIRSSVFQQRQVYRGLVQSSECLVGELSAPSFTSTNTTPIVPVGESTHEGLKDQVDLLKDLCKEDLALATHYIGTLTRQIEVRYNFFFFF